VEPNRLFHLGQGFVMYFTYQNMLMQLFGVFAILVSLPIIIASSLEIELYYRPESVKDSLKLRPYDGTLLGIIDEITLYVSRIQLKSMFKVREKTFLGVASGADLFMICNLLGIVYALAFSVQIRKKLMKMYNSSHKNYETPGNYTLLMREVLDNKKEPATVMDINEIQEKIVNKFNLIAQRDSMI
jgi:hypothetical protein